MPIMLDHEKSFNGAYGAVYVDKPIIGKNELDFDRQIFNVRGYQTEIISSNVRMEQDGYTIQRNDSGFIRSAHDYLSETASHPWFVKEEFTNCSHSTSISFFIENYAERQNFLSEFGTAFEENTQFFNLHSQGLAVLKGVLPPVSVNDDPALWLALNKGYQAELSETAYTIRPEYEILEEELVAEWVDNKGFLLPNGDGSYACTHTAFMTESEKKTPNFTDWLEDHARVKIRTPFYSEGFSFRCGDIQEAFNQQKFEKMWAITYDNVKNIYKINVDLDRTSSREVPSALRDYLNGQAPDPTPPGFKLPPPLTPIFTS